jgi:anti-sigma factor ChrR (cupin superfamily)
MPATTSDQAALPLAATASRYLDVGSMPWQSTGCPGVDWKILYEDDRGVMTALVRWAPGSRLWLHEHVDIEQTYVIEGSLEDPEGTCKAGDFVWRPAGNRHEAWSPNGALLVAIFQKPNVFLAGPFAGKELR